MNKNNKKIIIIFTAAIILLLFVMSLVPKQDKNVTKPVAQDSELGEEILPQKISEVPAREIISVVKVAPQNKEDIQNGINATLLIPGQTYNTTIPEGKNVYELMTFISSDNEEDSRFTFQEREHQGLGYFVYEINGIKGKSGAYWIYYINGKEANVGISKYIVKNGDVIEWKQE